jgi:hypothetical protein
MTASSESKRWRCCEELLPIGGDHGHHLRRAVVRLACCAQPQHPLSGRHAGAGRPRKNCYAYEDSKLRLALIRRNLLLDGGRLTRKGPPPMSSSQQFLKFAADCESIGKLMRDRPTDPDWGRLAERWVSCAEWAERQSLAAEKAQLRRREQRSQQR